MQLKHFHAILNMFPCWGQEVMGEEAVRDIIEFEKDQCNTKGNVGLLWSSGMRPSNLQAIPARPPNVSRTPVVSKNS